MARDSAPGPGRPCTRLGSVMARDTIQLYLQPALSCCRPLLLTYFADAHKRHAAQTLCTHVGRLR